jgi:hypothetical protein
MLQPRSWKHTYNEVVGLRVANIRAHLSIPTSANSLSRPAQFEASHRSCRYHEAFSLGNRTGSRPSLRRTIDMSRVMSPDACFETTTCRCTSNRHGDLSRGRSEARPRMPAIYLQHFWGCEWCSSLSQPKLGYRSEIAHRGSPHRV